MDTQHDVTPHRDNNPLYNIVWQPWEDQFLKSTYGNMATKLIAHKLERSVAAIHTRARRFGLYKHEGVHRRRESKKVAPLTPLPCEVLHALYTSAATPTDFARAVERAHGIGVAL